MEFEIKPQLRIEDGKHKGKIVGVEYRDKPYQYTDVVIEMSETDIKLKASYPSFITTESKLGNLLARFGAELTVGKFLNPEKVLVNKDCEFVTITEKEKFAKVVSESLVPVKEK